MSLVQSINSLCGQGNPSQTLIFHKWHEAHNHACVPPHSPSLLWNPPAARLCITKQRSLLLISVFFSTTFHYANLVVAYSPLVNASTFISVAYSTIKPNVFVYDYPFEAFVHLATRYAFTGLKGQQERLRVAVVHAQTSRQAAHVPKKHTFHHFLVCFLVEVKGLN